MPKIIKEDISLNGLFIDEKDPSFAATPDGTIDDDGIVEVKNPYCATDLAAEQAMEKYPSFSFIDKRN